MNGNRGSILIFVLVLLVVLGTAAAVVLGATTMQARVSREKSQLVKSFHAANAGLDYVKYYIKASNYAANGRNEWLLNHSSDSGYLVTSTLLPELDATNARITITSQGSSPWYCIESRVPVGGDAVERVIEVWVREREPFSEYMFFVGGSIRFGETTVAGRVHSNGTITYNRGCRTPGTNEPAKMWGDTTATGGYDFNGSGSFEELFTIYNDDGSVKYVSDHDFSVAARPMPETNDINTLWAVGHAGGYDANSTIKFVTREELVLGEYKYVTRVILDGDGVERDLPDNGVIACNTSNVTITGTTTTAGGTTYNVAGINGRVTIVNKSTSGSGQISISSPIIYIDENGHSYYQHREADGTAYDYKTANYFNDAGKHYWTSDTDPKVQFVRNPNYTGNSAVGMVAAEDIRYGVGTPAGSSMQIDAAILANGKFGYDHDNLVKRNLRITGSLTFNGSYGRYSSPPKTGKGYSYSGIYQYDQKLRGNSPPFFLGTARPDFFAWRVVH